MPDTTWPVTIGGEVFAEADFAGNNYVTGLPRLMAAAVRHAAEIHTSTSTSAVTVGTGAKTLTVEAGKPWAAGQPLRIARTSAPTTVYMDAIVTAYNVTTGVLDVSVAVAIGAGIYADWTLTVGGARLAATLPLAVAEGGTGATTVPAARTALGLDALLAAKTDLTRSKALMDWWALHQVGGVPATLWLLADPTVAVPPGATFARGTGNAAYVNALGNIAYASASTLRHDFDPVTGEYLGWLIEGARTNNFTRAVEFDHADWAKSKATVLADAVAAPDGTTTADKLVEDNTNGQHYALQSPTMAGPVCFSVFVKAGERAKLDIGINSSVGGWRGFDLSNGTSYANQTAAVAASTYGIEDFGGGWYRVWVVDTLAASEARACYIILSDGSAASYTGDGASGLYVWGAQLEAGAFPTSYIPTVSAAATRSADVMTVAASGFAFNPAEGTLYVDYSPLAAVLDSGSARGILALDDGGANNRIEMTTNPGGATVTYRNVSSGAVDVQFNLSGLSLAANVFTKMAAAFKAADYAACADAGTVTIDIAAAVPAVTTLRLGSAPLTGASGHYKHVAYFPRRLADADLQTITE